MKKENKKAWSGRFTEPTHPLVEKFNASIMVDRRLYKQDIRASIAHATMLGRQGIIPETDADKIAQGLRSVEKEIDGGKFTFDISDEDIHMAVERRLKDIIGPVAGKLHTARSRNDQVATDFRLFVRDATDEIIALIRDAQKVLRSRAEDHVDTIAPSYTHLQMAQPIRLAHWFLAHYEMLDRDAARFIDARKRVNVLPLGSAALAGTNFPIDRKWVADQLGFAAISKNSMEAVGDRDFAAEFLFCAAMTATHLSRLAEELVIFTTTEFSVMELPDAFCTGSSIMPQKKNPDVPELIRGKTGRMNGHLVAMLTLMKGLPLAYNKDLQEDKEPVFDAVDQLTVMLRLTADMMSALRADKDKLAARAEEGYMTAVDIADALVMDGVPFREAHEIVGKLVRECINAGRKFAEMPAGALSKIDERLVKIVGDLGSMANSADGKNVPGGTAKKQIMTRLKEIDREMKKW